MGQGSRDNLVRPVRNGQSLEPLSGMVQECALALSRKARERLCAKGSAWFDKPDLKLT